jgi:hypothetical protein
MCTINLSNVYNFKVHARGQVKQLFMSNVNLNALGNVKDMENIDVRTFLQRTIQLQYITLWRSHDNNVFIMTLC